MAKIKVAIVGIGNCASSLVQGNIFYKDVRGDDPVPGLITTNFGGYFPGDIEFVTAIDIDRRKVGKDLSKAIFAKPNCTKIFQPEIPDLKCPVIAGYQLDGVFLHNNEYSIDERFDPIKPVYGSEKEALAATRASVGTTRSDMRGLGLDAVSRSAVVSAYEGVPGPLYL